MLFICLVRVFVTLRLPGSYCSLLRNNLALPVKAQIIHFFLFFFFSLAFLQLTELAKGEINQ